MPEDLEASDALDVALLVAAALTQVGAEYFVGGSIASSLQGEPRPSFEVDVEMLRAALSQGSCANL